MKVDYQKAYLLYGGCINISIIRESIPHLESFYIFVFSTLQSHKTETKHQKFVRNCQKTLKRYQTV